MLPFLFKLLSLNCMSYVGAKSNFMRRASDEKYEVEEFLHTQIKWYEFLYFPFVFIGFT